MQTAGRSTELRRRLSYGTHSVRVDAFVETIRQAVGNRNTPDTGAKRDRLLQQDRNWAYSAAEGLYELEVGGTSDDSLLRIGAHFARAVRDFVKSRTHRPRLLVLESAIETETAVNGVQNVRSNDVLIGTLTLQEVEALWEATRAQIEASQQLLDACEDRARELRDLTVTR